MLQHTLFILLLIAIPPSLAAGEFDFHHPDEEFEEGAQPVETEQVPQTTWFGMGYELRGEKGERSLFEDSAMHRSVFSESDESLAIPSSPEGEATPAGAPEADNGQTWH